MSEPYGLKEHQEWLDADPNRCAYCGQFLKKDRPPHIIYVPDSDLSAETIDSVCPKCHAKYS